MFRFYISLWASKLYLFISKLSGNSRSDRVGILAIKICPDFLAKLNKPKLVILVTGTNGKSTVTNLINDIFKLTNKRISFNDWNANMIPGHIRCLLDCVNIFNIPNKKDVAILECDELTSNISIPSIKPNYIIVTNISRDSIRRNAYPEYIYNRINNGVNNSKDSFIILNADDPISSFLGKNNNKKYISLNKEVDLKPYKNITNDFPVCPKCNHEIVYDERYYRHIGKFHCSNCELKSFGGDYKINDYNKEHLLIGNNKYRAFSDNIFNIYNEAQVIVLFKELGFSNEFIKEALEQVNIPKSRENLEIKGGVNIYSRLAKGQNASAASTVFETLAKDKKEKQLVLLLDEVYGTLDANETITWLYDTDFELLNKKHITKIIVVSKIGFDYKLRLLLAGVKEEKVECVNSLDEVIPKLELKKGNNIYVLYEVERRPDSRELISKIKNNIKEEEK